jgi:hypothetical protein
MRKQKPKRHTVFEASGAQKACPAVCDRARFRLLDLVAAQYSHESPEDNALKRST